jgi:putative alpha-1,2-mannosidase
MTINGRIIDVPIIRHEDIANGGEIVFEMSGEVESWGNELLVSEIFLYNDYSRSLT